MKLYGDLISPFVRMSMITALECDLGMRVQLVNMRAAPDKVTAELEALSPIAKVPVLETEHGHALYDSRVIMEYFCHVSGNKKLLPDEGNKHFRVLTLLALACGLGDASVTLRYEQFSRPRDAVWPEFEARQKARLAACMKEMQGKWLGEMAEVNLGSIAAAVVLHYIDLRSLAPGWRETFPQLSEWHSAFIKRDSFRNTEPKA
ncbi:glutathione S-transferase N-terminal domain-containing protein [Aestuariivirga litoralis]|uniref:glutathione S-transferase N-terminal domain-containing protein n=1 Tax=Aestuariivirga litoralis TaxID=2650924 RepID=UPI0018C79743|nr:glutathione S-transferase N-terminal domain-containing protein [Aestuariivirga litoralis]MBG1231469.1 hypothetical protein [Aestuariivirga litoralis]